MLRFSVITYTFGRLTTKKHNKVMKKLIFLFAFCLTVTNIFAQTDPSQLKKEGSACIFPFGVEMKFIESICIPLHMWKLEITAWKST